jgi:hypothetical protein
MYSFLHDDLPDSTFTLDFAVIFRRNDFFCDSRINDSHSRSNLLSGE